MVYEAIKGKIIGEPGENTLCSIGKTGIINSKFGRNRRPVI